jgi:general secretion pathway protein L
MRSNKNIESGRDRNPMRPRHRRNIRHVRAECRPSLSPASRSPVQGKPLAIADLERSGLIVDYTAFAELPPGEGAPARLKVLEMSLQSAIGRRLNVPRMLRITLLCSGLAAAVALMLAAYAGNMLDAEQQQLLHRIAERRASLRLGQTAAGGSALSLLAKRKQTTPSSVMVLEAISRVLPDTTYVTELRIEGDKVQVVGISQDAPSLIRLMEQSPQFSRATFFAPTTRAQSDPGERFHIEVHITPYFGSGT